MEVRIHWAGGRQTYRRLRRPVRRVGQLSSFAELRDRLRILKGEGLDAPRIAERLNAEGWRRPKRGARFTGRVVRRLLARRGIAQRRRRGELGPDDRWSRPDPTNLSGFGTSRPELLSKVSTEVHCEW